MRTGLLLIAFFLSSVMTMDGQENNNDYLRKVLSNLENIKTDVSFAYRKLGTGRYDNQYFRFYFRGRIR